MAHSNIYGGRFCSPDERAIATIGTGYIPNFISSGTVARDGATLTNKRIYYSGKSYESNNRGGLTSHKQQTIVNVRDITGTGYFVYAPLSYLIGGVISIVLGIAAFMIEIGLIGAYIGWGGIVAGVAFVVAYFIGRKTLFTIEYAGGGRGGMIAFDVRWIQAHEQDNFIRDIHLTKDKQYRQAATEQGFVSVNNSADDDIPDL